MAEQPNSSSSKMSSEIFVLYLCKKKNKVMTNVKSYNYEMLYKAFTRRQWPDEGARLVSSKQLHKKGQATLQGNNICVLFMHQSAVMCTYGMFRSTAAPIDGPGWFIG